MQVGTKAQRMGKIQSMISHLPENPSSNIIWIVYNDDMIQHIQDSIVSQRGQEYLNNHVKVVSRRNSSKHDGKIYFDPYFFDLWGNGNN